jgi:hypothetical protein
MLPHERSLVERLKDEPFALVGVNSDPDFEELKKKRVFDDAGISWRSFTDFRLDRETGKLLRISQDWKVSSWPTLFLIDAQGKFRRMWRGAPENGVLDREIDALVAETRPARGDGGKSQERSR